MAVLSSLPPLRRLAGGLLLALSWAPASAGNSAADYFVRNLPGAPAEPPIKMHAGHIEVDAEHNGNLFFWHFENQHIADRQRTVVWLNGGPGCSSEDGALMEIGPYRVSGENLVYNNGTWNQFANLLFVDNPVGTGFSYVDTNSYLHELDEMAAEFVKLLEAWFELFPQYKQDELYFAGESYAGQHIPYIAKHILDRNENNPDKWNLKGLIIGNGWIAPKEQYEAYLTFAYEKDLLHQGSDEAKKLEQQLRICKQKLASGVKIDVGSCEAVLQDFLETTAVLNSSGKRQCFNMYDVRLKDSYPSCGMNWPPDLPDVTKYLRRKDVTNALHISSDKSTGWKECNGAVGSAFRAHNSVPAIDLLPDILTKTSITLFSGAEDLICNHVGTEEFIKGMSWNGGKGWDIGNEQQAPQRKWTFEGGDAGYWQEARNLSYVLFNEASHMVPFDWPRRTQDMLNRIMGVDVELAGQMPHDSFVEGDAVTNHTVTEDPAADDTKTKVDQAKWDAYYRSGSVVLVIVIIAAGIWGWYIWRERRKRHGYQGIAGGESHRAGARGIDRFQERGPARDVETGDFDESELDDLHVATPTVDKEAFRADDSDDEDEKRPTRGAGSSSRR
ncbi:pheromone-processing carboxypeptidase KEX1 [Plectosphaerella plurivora]|uniref:Pheromone-processing carboxypeptidase KEX1 n=1 Tax=Plectosphaerella plurivora TaxID=936078 RepID=A0A9P8VG32_9PEZI|nr:pheromone-processing carboxypeptidase KEX1 [Plectosphaerella plurivora]